MDLTRLMFEKLLGTVVLACTALIGGTILLAHYYGDSWLWHLAWFMLACCLLRLSTVVAFQRSANQSMTVRSALRWEVAYGIALICCTSSLAISTLYNFRFHDQLATGWCTLGMLSTASGINSRLALKPWIGNASVLLMLASLSVGLMLSPEPMARLAVIMVLFFAYAHCVSTKSKFAIVIEQIRTRRQLSDLAQHDALTGLANRRLFEERLATAHGLMAPFAVLYLDLDGFKGVNDTHGHATGDALLRSVADRLRGMLRDSDLLARLGGDEFAILQSPDACESSAAALAERINQDIGMAFEIDGNRLEIGASVGVALSTLLQADPAHLLGAADRALYRVKQAGRGGFCLAQA